MFRFVKSLAAVSLIALVGFVADNANAATVTVGSVEYEITTISGSFNDNQSILENQVWWGDPQLAKDLSFAVGAELGLYLSNSGPAFAFGTDPGTTAPVVEYYYYSDVSFGGPISREGNFGLTQPLAFDFAVASVPAVPIPAGGILLLTGLASVAVIKLRKGKRS